MGHTHCSACGSMVPDGDYHMCEGFVPPTHDLRKPSPPWVVPDYPNYSEYPTVNILPSRQEFLNALMVVKRFLSGCKPEGLVAKEWYKVRDTQWDKVRTENNEP